MSEASKLRLKLPSGAEFEATGDPEFIRSERAAFIDLPNQLGLPTNTPAGGPPRLADWAAIVESQGSNLQLKAKLKSDKNQKDACLVLLAAAQKLINQPRPTAAQLARWLRASGDPVQRMDRALAEALGRGEMLASGSRRARRYQLTGPGLLKASLLAEQLAATVSA
jgi:hypothetical protein